MHSSTRYCNQNNFNCLFCGDINYFGRYDSDDELGFVDQIDGRNFTKSAKFPSLTNNRRFDGFRTTTIFLKGDIYLFDCLDNSADFNILKVEKYSIVNDSLEVVADMFNDRRGFCACGFLDKVFFVGGNLEEEITDTCIQFVTKDYTWKDVASMNEARFSAACTVFEGRVVVSGGLNNNDITLNTVEAYDHVADEWSYMPNMIEAGCGHHLVAVRNKLFVMGDEKKLVEVYDSTCEKFVVMKQPTIDISSINILEAISMGNKVVMFIKDFNDFKSYVLCYDVDEDEWNKEPCVEATQYGDYQVPKQYIKVPKLTV